jgi:hypothetical protein
LDVIERKIKHERKRKYKLLRKFRQARDIATKHTYRRYTCNFLRSKITLHDEFSWLEQNTKDNLAVTIYEWSERERNMFK